MSPLPGAINPDNDEVEPERYELHQNAPGYKFDVSRRDFCRVLGGGLLVMLVLPASTAEAQEREQSGRPGRPALPQDLAAWIRIDETGRVHACTGKAEVGQGTRTMLSQVVAEELRIPIASVLMIMGDTGTCPYDRGTFGSRSTPDMAPQLRRAAAAAREALIDLAAGDWKLPRERIEIRDGKLVESAAGGRTATLAAIVKGRALTRQIDAGNPVTPVANWTIAGKPEPSVTGVALVTGTHKYPSDIRLEGMLYGAIVRPSAFDSKLVTANTSEAEKLPGVTVVRDNNFLGVAAPTPTQARRAAALIDAQWSAPPPGPTHETVFDYFKSNEVESRSGRGGGSSPDGTGDIEQGLAAAAKRAEATFNLAYIAHAPLEPRAAVAQWEGAKLTVWTGTQRPFGVRTELAQAFSIPEESVRVIMPDTGSGYGGKHSGEAALEAARLARGAGKPVKLVWSREEEFTWAYFRPAGVIEVKAGAMSDGTLSAWEQHNWNSGPSGIRTPYEVANRKTQFHATKSPLRQGSYRALAATGNNFARESLMDELAGELKLDPLKFRMMNLKDERLRAVLQAVATEIGWETRKKQAGSGFGIACGTEKGGYVATAVELKAAADSNRVQLLRAIIAFECGAILNPQTLRNQVEGGLIQALGGALFETIWFGEGRIGNASFAHYPVPRFRDLFPVKTILLDRKDLASAGAGETPLIALAPAIANAIADATGMRIRSLPLSAEL